MLQNFILKDVREPRLLFFRTKRCQKLDGTEQSRKYKYIPRHHPVPNPGDMLYQEKINLTKPLGQRERTLSSKTSVVTGLKSILRCLII